jgi:dipeptidyl-peptidase-4
MHRSRVLLPVGILLLAIAAFPHAQPSDRVGTLNAQIDRIFGSSSYQVPRFGPARWLADGTAYTTVERSAPAAPGAPAAPAAPGAPGAPAPSAPSAPSAPGAPGGAAPSAAWDIVRYDATSGARAVLIAGSTLVPPGTSSPLSIDDYAWSADGRRLLLFTNTRRVWRQNTRGDYWVFDLADRRLRKLGGDAPESSLMFAKFSPDGTRAAYVRANDIYVERINDGAITRVTSDGSETTVNGTSDWVYEEELGVRDGFRWSPDGTRIAYWQFDTTGVGIFSLINTTDTLYPVITRIPYPKVGTTNSAVRIGVVEVASRETRWMKTPGDPRDTYLARLEWRDARTVAIQQLNRLQNQNNLLVADVRSGDVQRVFRDSSATWVEVMDEVPWIDDGRAFLWLSERSGWQHVYRVPRQGGEPVSLTRFDADVTELAGIDESRGLLYVVASPQNATERYLYRAPLDGSGVPERVTPSSQPGTHAYNIAPGGGLAFHTYSRFDQPPAVDVVDLTTHRSLRPLTDTTALTTALAPVIRRPVEFFTVEIGETGARVSLDGWMLKPHDFDAARRYPVIVFVYGEPAGQTVLNRWGGNQMLFHRALADAGYVVLSVDNRGTPAPRGAAWRKIVYGTVGDLSSKDQDAAIRALLARHSYLDGERVGIWGWSGGGSNTLNAMFRFPKTYRVGVSVAPVPDQRLYDTIYQERYMGLPRDNAEGYRIGSPINFAAGLEGKLLLVHGTGDDNVHAQGTERLVNRLIELGKTFDAMMYPNRTHAIAEGPGTTTHIYRLIARYFVDNLPPGGK